MTEELKQKAINFIRKTKCNPKDRPDEQIEILHEEELELLIGFATEATKELQEENRQLKNIKDVADLLRLNNDTVITMCQLNNQLVSANQKIAELEAQIEKMKSDVIKSFGDEFNILVAKLLKEWEIKEK